MMQIDFYILEEASIQQSRFFVCQLVEKLFGEQKRVYLHTNSQQEAEQLDALLWTYKDNSFIPHNLYHSDEQNPPLIQLGFGAIPLSHCDVLINFCREMPQFQGDFARLIEIVYADPLIQRDARERFKLYREQGYTLNTHKLKAHELNQATVE